jgi:hypothetical protein
MAVADRYRWEAEKDGEVVTIGGDLAGCSRFSFIPEKDGLPRHDLIGKKFKRRFNRGFKKTPLFGYHEMLARLELSPDDQKILDIAKAVLESKKKDYQEARKNEPTNISKHNLMREKTAQAFSQFKAVVAMLWERYNPSDHYYLCVVYAGGRAYVNARTGAVLVTPENYELFV